MESDREEYRKLYCGNLSPDADDDLLHELFLQGGPLEKITMPKDNQGYHRGFAFIVYKHECSVPYAIELFRDTSLFGRLLQVKTARRGDSSNSNHQRSHSEPSNYNSHMPNRPTNFDELLAMSKNMLTASPQQQVPSWDHTFHPQLVPMGGPANLVFAPPPNMYHSFHPNEPLGFNTQPSMHFPSNNEGAPSFSSSSLSRSSLQGNWSMRNDSNMLPTDSIKRSNNHRRNDRDHRMRSDHGRRNDSFDRNEGPYDDKSGHRRGYSYDANQEFRDGRGGGYYREKGNYRSHNDRSDRDDHRSRSGNLRERKGRY